MLKASGRIVGELKLLARVAIPWGFPRETEKTREDEVARSATSSRLADAPPRRRKYVNK